MRCDILACCLGESVLSVLSGVGGSVLRSHLLHSHGCMLGPHSVALGGGMLACHVACTVLN